MSQFMLSSSLQPCKQILITGQFMKKSQIRPPSRIPSPGKGLCEISESQSNVRSKASAIPPAQTTSKYNGLSCECYEALQYGCHD